ncbi:hypothetical protein [Spirillospora sp. NPDC047279]|uniref:hypothetical protein n=1 Tax=Spirillospora sp. NPDC047279 TaxID=3155478 RepID=UPI0034013A3D
MNYAGAVYGSLLAASVVIGTSPRNDPAPAPRLIILLVATGFVFWLVHVHASLAGDGRHAASATWPWLAAVARHEWPLAQASFPPAIAATACLVLGVGDAGVAWMALLVALAGQVGWGIVADTRSGASTRFVLVSAAFNLFLGMIVVLLKVTVTH